MSVDNISGSVVYSSLQLLISSQNASNTGTTQNGNVDVNTSSTAGAAGSAGSGNSQTGSFMSSIMQTLNQLGISPASQNTSAGTSASNVSNDGYNDSAGSGMSREQKKALHTFMHGLFQALHQSNTNTQAVGPTNANGGSNGSGIGNGNGSGNGNNTGNGIPYAALAGYNNNLGTQLQSLLQNLGSGSTGTTEDNALSRLNSSFQNLLQTFGNSNGTGTTNAGSDSQPTLQSFLQSLTQNLPSQQRAANSVLSTVGAIISTTA
ncbi:MAG: hypothetical protein HQK89_02770 [Nitrospirae bacterium]|nr:hypothetical protein [Nitrospirota bacterium]